MPESNFLTRIETARNGTNPSIICRMPSGWVALADMQYLRGYCILLADPVVESINTLDHQARSRFMLDMSIVGDALIQVTHSFRINYGMMSNADPYLHAHIVPRYMDEPEAIRRHLPWSYSKEHMASTPFNFERDGSLMTELKQAIEALL
jgi:diadenosine tetraphosphate (Ap4A) HIT family hydrolase